MKVVRGRTQVLEDIDCDQQDAGGEGDHERIGCQGRGGMAQDEPNNLLKSIHQDGEGELVDGLCGGKVDATLENQSANRSAGAHQGGRVVTGKRVS